jgi:hypothetical protein
MAKSEYAIRFENPISLDGPQLNTWAPGLASKAIKEHTLRIDDRIQISNKVYKKRELEVSASNLADDGINFVPEHQFSKEYFYNDEGIIFGYNLHLSPRLITTDSSIDRSALIRPSIEVQPEEISTLVNSLEFRLNQKSFTILQGDQQIFQVRDNDIWIVSCDQFGNPTIDYQAHAESDTPEFYFNANVCRLNTVVEESGVNDLIENHITSDFIMVAGVVFGVPSIVKLHEEVASAINTDTLTDTRIRSLVDPYIFLKPIDI